MGVSCKKISDFLSTTNVDQIFVGRVIFLGRTCKFTLAWIIIFIFYSFQVDGIRYVDRHSILGHRQSGHLTRSSRRRGSEKFRRNDARILFFFLYIHVSSFRNIFPTGSWLLFRKAVCVCGFSCVECPGPRRGSEQDRGRRRNGTLPIPFGEATAEPPLFFVTSFVFILSLYPGGQGNEKRRRGITRRRRPTTGVPIVL